MSAFLLLAPALADARGGQVLSEMACPVPEPAGMALLGDSLWLSDFAGAGLVQVRRADGVVVGKHSTAGLSPTGLAWHDGVLFVGDRDRDTIARRGPGEPTDRSPIPYYEGWTAGIAHDGKHLWVVDALHKKLHELDPEDGTTIRSFDAPGKGPTGLAFDGQYLWVADHEEDSLYMVDRRDGSVIVVLNAPGPYPNALAADEGSLWVADYQTGKLARVALPDETPYVEDQERRVHASYELLYRGAGQGAVEQLVAYVAIPRDLPGQHQLGELRFRPEPTRRTTDRWGQPVAVFELGKLAAGETRTVTWEADFALYRTRFHVVPERVGDDLGAPELRDYLGDADKYQLDSPAVGKIVDEVAGKDKGIYRRTRALFEHLAKLIRYDRASGWNGAAAVLERGTGSCSEYTFALVALLRKAGVPARYVGAISERGDAASFDDVFHRWAEAYFPGYGWVPLDANAAHDGSPAEHAEHFAARSNRHVVTTISGGPSELLGWDYNSHETYRTSPQATLQVRQVARYRPLAGGEPAVPASAPKVLAPRLVEPSAGPAAEGAPGRSGGRLPWWVALLALGGGLGIGGLATRRWAGRPG